MHQFETKALPRELNTPRGSRVKRITFSFKFGSDINSFIFSNLNLTVLISLIGCNLQVKLRNSGMKHIELESGVNKMSDKKCFHLILTMVYEEELSLCDKFLVALDHCLQISNQCNQWLKLTFICLENVKE